MTDAASALLRAVDPPTFVPVLARVGGIVSFFPLLGNDTLPVRFRIVLAAALAWMLRPFVPVGDVTGGAGDLAGRIAFELLVGAVLGYAAHVALAGFEAAGHLAGFQMGLTLSGVIDPINGEQVTALSVLYRFAALVLYFSLDAHHAFILAVRDSYGWLGPSLAPGADFAATAARVSGEVFVLALRIAAPAVVVSVILDVALLLAARALPQVNLLILGYPMKIGLGLLAVATGLVVVPALARESLLAALDQARELASFLAPPR